MMMDDNDVDEENNCNGNDGFMMMIIMTRMVWIEIDDGDNVLHHGEEEYRVLTAIQMIERIELLTTRKSTSMEVKVSLTGDTTDAMPLASGGALKRTAWTGRHW
jgi:hypothetical protein